MNPNDDDLLERAYQDDLTPEEEETLAARIKSDPAVARRMVELSRDEAILAEGVTEARARQGLGPPKRAPASSSGRMRWIIGLAAAALLAIVLLPRDGTPGTVLSELQGQADIDDRPASIGDRVAPGQTLRTGPESRATLRFPDDATIILSGSSRLAVEAGRARLHSGALSARLNPRPSPLIFVTPHAEVRILGTRFALSTDEASTFLEVLEGKVELRRDRESVELAAGQFAEAAPGKPLIVERTTDTASAAAPPDFGSGRGLRAEYFDNEDLTNLKLSRIDPTVDFVWGLGSPHPSIEPDYFSVRWRGEVEPLYSEAYTFHVVSDDGARLWVDRKLIVDDWNVRGTREQTGKIELAAGKRYDVRLEYFECVSPARASLLWSSLSQKKEPVPTRQLYPAPSSNHLFEESFSEGKLTPGLWDARLEGASFDPGYLIFSPAPPHKAPSLYTTRAYERKAGLCLATVFCGTVSRGGHKGENAVFQFSQSIRPADRARAGPGWMPGQHQGRSLNTAIPLVEKTGLRNYPIRNDNIDTLFLTVLREKGAFSLVCGEPSASPPRAKLVHASHTGDAKAYHVGVSGGNANSRIASVTLTDLGGAWAEPYGIATFVDRFDRAELGATWKAEGSWSIGGGRVTATSDVALMLTPGGDGQWEVTVTPSAETKSVALMVRAKDADNHYRFELSAAGTKLIRRIDGKDAEVTATGWREIKLVPGATHRLAVHLDGPHVNLFVDDVAATYGWDLPPLDAPGTQVGLLAVGKSAAFSEFVGWPLAVDIPEALSDKIPPVYSRADGAVVIQDDFEAPSGTPLEDRKPKLGAKTWKTGKGEWVIENGAAALRSVPGWVRLDCGYNNYEITTTIEFPPKAPPEKKDWFPGIQARCGGPGPLDAVGGVSARFLWQSGSNEIEVWDRPPHAPESAKWAAKEGPNKGRVLTELINATNITPMLRPGEKHVLRILVRGSRVSYFCDDLLVGTANTRVSHGPWVGLAIDEHGDPGIRFHDFTVRAFRIVR